MEKIIPTLPYIGGKTSMIREINTIILYAYRKFKFKSIIDIFGGSGKVLINIPDEVKALRVYNDIDSRWYNYFNVIKDDEKRKKLIELLALTTASREEFNRALEMVDKEEDEVLRAYYFAYLLINSLSASPKKGFNNSRTEKMQSSTVKSLIEYSYKIKRWQIEKRDAIELLKSVSQKPYIFVYLDPPYIDSSTYYNTSTWNEEKLRELKRILDNSKCLWLLNEKVTDKTIEILGEPKLTKTCSTNLGIINIGKHQKRVDGFWFNFDIDDVYLTRWFDEEKKDTNGNHEVLQDFWV